MDIDLGLYHCQREEAIVTSRQDDKTMNGSEDTHATLQEGARSSRKTTFKDRVTGRPGDAEEVLPIAGEIADLGMTTVI